MIKWQIKKIPLKSLKPHPKNPRTISKHQLLQLEQSIAKYGVIDKPIVNTDNMIIGGHQRIQIMKKYGIQEIECWVPDSALSDTDVDELCIRLNRNQGEFDFDVLANEWDLSSLIEHGFTEKDLLGISSVLEEELSEEAIFEENQVCETCGQNLKPKKKKKNESG